MDFYRTYLFSVVWLLIIPLSLAPDVIQIPTSHMTQSEAHLSIPANRREVETWYHVNDNPFFQDIWRLADSREQKFNDTHYVFYNATTNIWRIPQDLFLKLFLQPRRHDRIQSFRVFRFTNAQDISPEEYIKDIMNRFGMIDDTKRLEKEYLMSTNLALFGNVDNPGESSFTYWLDARSNTSVDADSIRRVFKFFGLNNEVQMKEILALDQYLQGESVQLLLKTKNAQKEYVNKWPGTLYQIFIPKEIVDQVAYLSWIRGVPYDTDLVSLVVQKVHHMSPARAFDEVRRDFEYQKMNNWLYRKVYEGIDQGAYKVAAKLDWYKRSPECVPYLNNLQARLIITPKYLRNYGTNVHVFAYDTISGQNKYLYEQELDRIVKKIIEANVPPTPQPIPRGHEKQLSDLASAFEQLGAPHYARMAAQQAMPPRSAARPRP